MKPTFFYLWILTLGLFSSCGQREQKMAVAEKLQEKYGEEFTVVDARYSVMSQVYNFSAYPKSNRDMHISGIHNADLSYFSDSYASQRLWADYHSYLRKELEEVDYYLDSKDSSPDDFFTGVFHIEGHFTILDEQTHLPDSFFQEYAFAPQRALSLDIEVHISSDKDEPLLNHTGLQVLYGEYQRLLEQDDSFFSLNVHIWDKDSLTPYLLHEMRKGRGIPSDFNPRSNLGLYLRTDEYADPMSYDDFLRYLQEAESGRDFIHLNELMKLCSFRIKTLQRIILTDYTRESSKTMEIYRGYKEEQLFSTLYREDIALDDTMGCYRFLQILELMKSPELVADKSSEWELKRQWVFQEKELESSLKIYQNASGEWFGTNSHQPQAFRIPPEYLEELMSFPNLP